MMYLTQDRIGPMEGGAFDGQYIEPGTVVDESVFRPESIPLLVESGALVAADGNSSPVGPAFAVPAVATGPGPALFGEPADNSEEDADGTHDSNGD